MLLQKLSGYVIKIADGIATLTLNQANNLKIKYGEMILFETRLLNTQNKAYPLYGQILNIDGENSTVKAIIFGDDRLLSVGNKYFGLNQPLAIDPRKFFFGGYYDAFGNCLNSKNFRQIMQTLYYSIDQISRVYPYNIQNNKNSLIKSIDIIPIGLIKRQPIDTPVITGIKIIDGLFPIGRGQRELILGDRRSGKTAIALDMIQNQKRLEVNNEAMKSIYVGIGQKASSIADVIRKGVFFNFKDTIYICATASYPAPFLYVTPYAGCTLGEYFRDLGLHSLLIFDDLTKQAIAYRQLSLLLKRTPGREAYPGDIFYLHSRLLERAAYLVPELGAGSLTIIPVIETQAGDMTGYIPTNVISITDGQLFLETSLFYSGFRPAINIGLSVSRVGSKAQFNIVKKYTASLKLELSLFKELEVFTKMEESLDPVTEKILHRGKRILTILLQYPTYPLNVFQEFLIFYCGVQGHLDKLSTDNFEIQKFEYSLLKNPFNSLVPLLNYLDFFFLYYQKWNKAWIFEKYKNINYSQILKKTIFKIRKSSRKYKIQILNFKNLNKVTKISIFNFLNKSQSNKKFVYSKKKIFNKSSYILEYLISQNYNQIYQTNFINLITILNLYKLNLDLFNNLTISNHYSFYKKLTLYINLTIYKSKYNKK